MGVNILVIKLGALGDMVQALGPMAAIRRYHADVQVTALTTKPYATFLRASGFFDSVWVDSRPSLLNVGAWIELRRRFRDGGIRRVYDLQTSDRSGWYFRLFGNPRPEWSGIAVGCSHPHINPQRDAMHTIERQREQLAMAGIDDVPAPDVGWAVADLDEYGLLSDYTLLVPGGARHRPAKRWPQACYIELAKKLCDDGHTPVLIGGADELDLLGAIAAAVPSAVNLAGRTDLLQLAELSRRAVCAVGNDTGPMHLIAAAGCKAVVLYSHESDPALCAQRGAKVRILRRPNLDALKVATVVAALDNSTSGVV
jgi:ADP-heptose:LPS heptosyltransferase